MHLFTPAVCAHLLHSEGVEEAESRPQDKQVAMSGGDDDDKTRRPNQFTKTPDEVDNMHTQAEQRDDKPTGTGGVQIEGERKVADEENDQRTLTDEEDAPRWTQELPLSPTSPHAQTARRDQPPSVELEGERGGLASYDAAPEADLPEPCEDVEEVTDQLKKLRIKLGPERVDKNKSDSLGTRTKAKRAMHDQGGSADLPGSSHSTPGRPRGEGIQRIVETNARRRHRVPGGRGGEMAEEGGVESNPDHGKVTDSAERDGISPRSRRNERVVETNALRRGIGPGGGIGEKPEEDKPERAESDVTCRDGPHDTQKGPTSGGTQRIVETSARRRHRRPGGRKVELAELAGVEGKPHHPEVIERGGTDRIGPRRTRIEHDVETSALYRDPGLGGQLDKEQATRGDKDEAQCQSTRNGVLTHGMRGGKAGATSTARRDSKRVETDILLARTCLPYRVPIRTNTIGFM